MTLRREEQVVAALVEAVLPGARMRHVATQSNREWDFNLEVAGQVFPFESSLFPRRYASHDWWVFPSANANIRRVRNEVDLMLADVERDGLSSFDINGEGSDLASVERLWSELRIEYGTQTHWNPPGQIGIALPGEGAMLSADDVRPAVEHVANKEDIRVKLGASAAGERHLGVHIDDFGYPAQASMMQGLIPADPPRLPSEITHIWVTTYAGRDRDYLVWRFDTTHGWSDLGIVSASSARTDA